MAELTDEQISREDEFLKDLPRVNWGALIMPGIWGPAHGSWICILFYPLWIFIDYVIYGAYRAPGVGTVGMAVLCVALLVGLTVVFAIVQQPIAAHRAAEKGVTREQYLRRERMWAVASAVIAVAALAWATYYNLEIRTVLK